MEQYYSKKEDLDSVEQYITDEIRKLEINLNKAWSSFDELAIHDFRVSLKKLKAVLGFIQKYDLFKQGSGNLLKILKPVFKSGGRLRDLQVNHQLVRDYEKKQGDNLVGFRAFISTEILLVEEDFKNISKDLEDGIRGGLEDGKLPCVTAWRIGKDLGIGKMEVSSACEALALKICSCQIGAF